MNRMARTLAAAALFTMICTGRAWSDDRDDLRDAVGIVAKWDARVSPNDQEYKDFKGYTLITGDKDLSRVSKGVCGGATPKVDFGRQSVVLVVFATSSSRPELRPIRLVGADLQISYDIPADYVTPESHWAFVYVLDRPASSIQTVNGEKPKTQIRNPKQIQNSKSQ